MKFSFLAKTVLPLSGALVLLFILLGCSTKDKSTFAKTLARDIVSTTDRPDINGNTQFNAMEAADYRNDSLKIAIKLNGADLMGIGLKNAWKELITGKKADTGLEQDGVVTFNGYDSAFGEVEDQRLNLNRTLKGEFQPNIYVVYTIRGIIKNSNKDSVEVNYKFRLRNRGDSKPFDLDSIDMVSGAVKEGENVYSVLP